MKLKKVSVMQMMTAVWSAVRCHPAS